MQQSWSASAATTICVLAVVHAVSGAVLLQATRDLGYGMATKCLQLCEEQHISIMAKAAKEQVRLLAACGDVQCLICCTH